MSEKFELDRADRLTDILFGVATAGGLIGYGPAARRVGLRPDHLGPQLEKLSERAHAVDEPIWSALVVSSGNGLPKAGFFQLARRLRSEYANEPEDKTVWEAECERCYEYARNLGRGHEA